MFSRDVYEFRDIIVRSNESFISVFVNDRLKQINSDQNGWDYCTTILVTAVIILLLNQCHNFMDIRKILQTLRFECREPI